MKMLKKILMIIYASNTNLIYLLFVVWAVSLCESQKRYFEVCTLSETCVNIRRCPSLLELMREQAATNPIVVEALRRKHCGFDGGTPEVCCPAAQPPTSVLIPKSKPKPADSTFEECGKSEKNDIRIVAGKNASLGDWPWMVALSYRGPYHQGADFRCGATLVARQWILTAAHCVEDIGELEIAFARLGDLDLDDGERDGATPINVAVDRIVSHLQYTTNPTLNDIALIRLKNPVQYSRYIRPICLLNGPQYRNDEYYIRKQPFIIGWGAIGWGEQGVTRLQEAAITVVDSKRCVQQYAGRPSALINDRVFCAGIRGRGTCQGDSGGPVMFPNSSDNRFYLGGIVSYGVGCASDYPSVYTKVAHFVDWISNITGERFAEN